MNVGEYKVITVNDNEFKMILKSEEDGYYIVSRRYDLKYKGKLIAKDVPSIKSCYYKAWRYCEENKLGISYVG